MLTLRYIVAKYNKITKKIHRTTEAKVSCQKIFRYNLDTSIMEIQRTFTNHSTNCPIHVRAPVEINPKIKSNQKSSNPRGDISNGLSNRSLLITGLLLRSEFN